jgi:hypothetical protein
MTAAPARLSFIPRGTQHAFVNTGKRQARMLVHFTPSGMEEFLERISHAQEGDNQSFARIGGETGITIVGPPLAGSNRESRRYSTSSTIHITADVGTSDHSATATRLCGSSSLPQHRLGDAPYVGTGCSRSRWSEAGFAEVVLIRLLPAGDGRPVGR